MNKIQFKKDYNNIYQKARTEQKRNTCLICQKECSSFCKSHTLPEMILNNLQKSGKILTSFWGFGDNFNPDCLSQDIGKGVAGVFYEICNDCDNTIFQDYENIENLMERPNNKILKLVALKNNLYNYYKYRIESKTTPILTANTINNRLITSRNEKWAKEFEQKIENIKERLNNNNDDMYKILFWDKLNYKVPIAYQGLFAVNINFKGEMLYDFEPTIHMMIFPINNECSIVCLFCENTKQIIEHLGFSSTLRTQEDILSSINTMLLLYSEDYFINQHLRELLSENDKKSLHYLCYELEASFYGLPHLLELRKKIIINHTHFPNLLSKKYQINSD